MQQQPYHDALSSSAPNTTSDVRKFSEDPRFRPFLSTRFDKQGYIHTVLKEGRSEECFKEISNSIDEVNSEIKGYISAHKSDLMSGMQDVAILSDRYQNLTLVSDSLKSGIVKMKKDIADSHGQITCKIKELERIHSTSLALRYLRQFVHSKGQLDHFLKSTEDDKDNDSKKSSAPVTRDSIQIQNSHFDVRNLASVAKIINELETLIENPILKGIKEVSDHARSVKAMGFDLRKGAQTILFSALKNRNQSIIGACLQIFFHLQSLPEIILLVIDRTVKESLELIQATLDVDSLVRAVPDLASGAAALSSGSSSAAIAGTQRASLSSGGAVPTAPSGVKTSQTILTIPFPNSNGVLTSVKEFAQAHVSTLDEQTMMVYILQKVLLKKEDPSTHQKFVDVIRSLLSPSSSNTNDNNNINNGSNNISNSSPANNLTASFRELLGQGRFVDLFWERLGVSFQDILIHKLRSQPVALSRLYPSFRRLTVDTMLKYQKLAKSDVMSKDDLRIQLSFTGSDSGHHHDSAVFHPGQVYDPSVIANYGNQNENHIFGSLIWGQNQYADILSRHRKAASNEKKGSTTSNGSGSSTSSNSSVTSSSQKTIQSDTGLLMCFCSVRDRYLIGSQSRMTYPILQMFPEVDGYTAAIPSKRDIQTFFKAIHNELVIACVEGDSSLLQLVGKEALKAIQLMLSKLEAMVITSGADFSKINPTAALTFTKNGAQDHNCQLVNILILIRDSLERLPENISKQIHSEAISSTFYAFDARSSEGVAGSPASALVDITGFLANLVDGGISQVEDLVSKQLLNPLNDVIMAYIRTILLGLLKEGLTSGNSTAGATQSTVGGSLVEGSRAILSMQKQLPELVKAYVASLSPSRPAVNFLDDLIQRIMISYISIASSTRPLTEHARLRIAKDLSLLEDTITSIISTQVTLYSSGTASYANVVKQLQPKYFNADTNCLVALEFRSLKRLLFIENENRASQASGSSAIAAIPPTKKFLLSQPFILHMRPSIVLSHLICCAPTLLPSPWESAEAKYFESITRITETLSKSSSSTSARNSSISANSNAAIDISSSFYAHPWKNNPIEAEAWASIQQCLDLFLQRISVADESNKPNMKAWYDFLFDLGAHYFK